MTASSASPAATFAELVGNGESTIPAVWSGPTGRYAYDPPARPGPRDLAELRERIHRLGVSACAPHHSLLAERALRLAAAAWADAGALEAERTGSTGADLAREEAERQSFALRDFDSFHRLNAGMFWPHDPYFEDEPEASREYTRQEWAVRPDARPLPSPTASP